MLSVRLKRRSQPLTSPLAKGLLIVGPMVLALLVCAVPVMLSGANPLYAYRVMFAGAFGSLDGIADVVMRATPLLLTALGTTVAFKGGQWNIGGDGQIYFGALGATLTGLAFQGLPLWLHLPLAIAGGFLGGALWALPAALLKAGRGVSEIITTLMLNYIAVFFIGYLVKGPLQGPSEFMPQTATISETARLPLIFAGFRVHGGTVVAILLVAAVYFLLQRTSLGYDLRAVGENPKASRYGGIRVSLVIILIMSISGGLSGLAGANEVLGYHYRLFDGISPGYGFTGIIVALLGRLNPFGVLASSVLFSSLIVGANEMQRVVGVPTAIAGIIQATIVLFVLGAEILVDYRIAITSKNPRPASSGKGVRGAGSSTV
jgi:general nucleoside transport system permease protein